MPKRKRTASSGNTRPKKRAKRIARLPMSSIERKSVDIGPTTSQVNTTLIATLLNGTGSTVALGQRSGRKIQIINTFIRGFFFIEGLAAALATGLNTGVQYIRYMVIWDAQPNASAFAAADLLTNNVIPYSQYNAGNKERFVVLRDKHAVFDPAVYTTTATQALVGFNRTCFPFKLFVKVNKPTMTNTGVVGDISDITSGALYFCVMGSIPSATGTDSNVVWTARTRFTDI